MGVGDERPGDNATVDVHTPLEAFLNMPLKFASFSDEAFFW
jgi:hypothetical protein